MMKISYIVALLIVIIGCNSTKNVVSEKDDAKEFCKEVVHTYFNNDCKKNFLLWNDSIKIINPYNDTTVAMNNIHKSSEEWCERFNQSQRFMDGYTFDKYLKNYEMKIFSKDEFTNVAFMESQGVDPMIAEIFETFQSSFNSNDYFFSGNHLIDETSEDNLTHWRSWQMLVSKTDNGWKITGTLP